MECIDNRSFLSGTWEHGYKDSGTSAEHDPTLMIILALVGTMQFRTFSALIPSNEQNALPAGSIMAGRVVRQRRNLRGTARFLGRVHWHFNQPTKRPRSSTMALLCSNRLSSQILQQLLLLLVLLVARSDSFSGINSDAASPFRQLRIAFVTGNEMKAS